MKASRLISLLMLLQAHGRLTAADLARRLEVSTRTIYRDIDALSAAGVPVYTDRGPGGGCALLDNYRTTLTGLTQDEVRAIFMSTIPALMSDLGAGQTAASALLKLSAALPLPFQQEARRTRERIHLDPDGWFQWDEPTPFLPLIQQALWDERRLRMVYRTADGTWSKRLIEPYGLVAKGGVWYLVGSTKGWVWTCRVSRIEEAAITEGRFVRPGDFDLAAYWSSQSGAFEAESRTYEVVLRIPAGRMHLLRALLGEGVHHLAARSGRLDTGGGTTLPLHFASAEEACRRLLGISGEIEVVAPAALRRLLHKTALAAAAFYREAEPPTSRGRRA